jgi:hypothetical protein
LQQQILNMMSKIIVPVALIIILFIVSSCSTTNKIATLKPEPSDASPLVYENVPSVINLPISLKIKDIENQANTLLTDLMYEDNNIEDDNVEMKIWKQAPITIENDPENRDKKIKTVLPLKVYVKYRLGTQTMGVALYNTKEFNLNGVVTLSSEIALNNWKLSTKTELKNIDWAESPTMMVFGKNVPVTYLINPAIKLFRSKIEKKIDEAMAKAMDFKPNVIDALTKISTPFLMNDAYQSWLRIVPSEMYTTDVKLKKENLFLDMGMKCTMETLIGHKPESKFNPKTLIIKQVPSIPQQISANIAAVSTYADATTIMNKNFAGQEFGSGTKKVKVQNVTIWHKDGKMVIALDVLGTVNGTLYLAGFPQYNDKTKEIFFDKLDYALDTKNKLMRTANWLAQGLILKKIQQSCRYSIKQNLDDCKQNMMTYLKNYSPMPGVFVNGKMDDIIFDKIQLTNQAIIAFIKVTGSVNVAVDGLK